MQESISSVASHLGCDPADISFVALEQLLEGVAGVAPHGLLGIFFPNAAQHGQEGTLVLRLEGVAAQQGKPRYIGLVQLGKDLPLRVLREGLSKAEVPGFGLKAVFAAVAAAGHEQGDPHAFAVGNVAFFQFAVVHTMTSFPQARDRLCLPLVFMISVGITGAGRDP